MLQISSEFSELARIHLTWIIHEYMESNFFVNNPG